VPHPQETEYYINIHSVREVSLELQFYAQSHRKQFLTITG
jgi:hypothetical protein